VAELLLGPMLRHVGRTSATVWVETDRACRVEVLGREARTFCVEHHHYALVVIEDLEPGAVLPYEVALDGQRVWPPAGSRLPPSVIRTLGDHGPVRLLFGSCRFAAPHEAPWSLQATDDPSGRGTDALRAHALRMLGQPPEDWPHLVAFLGDQVYADQPSPAAKERMQQRRASDERPEHSLPPGQPAHRFGRLGRSGRLGRLGRRRPPADIRPDDLVADFEEYTWLYHESWQPEIERWLLSVVPSTMIFDDHDMVDDWNISQAWVTDIRRQPWWQEHVTGGLMSYWVYQHLGNLSPAEVRKEGILDALLDVADGTGVRREWAMRSEEFTPVPGGYRFSFARDLGPVRLVVVDARNGRVLEPGHRRMLDDDQFAFVAEQCRPAVEHLVIATSLPVFVTGALHDLQVWSEAICDGAWGRLAARAGERIRRAVDLEDWPAFSHSFDALASLLAEVGAADNPHAPATVTVLSGDFHFSYLARVDLSARARTASAVTQIVSSPIRNALVPHERLAIRFGLSHVGSLIGRALRAAARRPRTDLRWAIDQGPAFANNIGLATFDERRARVVIEHAEEDADGTPALTPVIEAEH
jgi:hypothetical protein